MTWKVIMSMSDVVQTFNTVAFCMEATGGALRVAPDPGLSNGASVTRYSCQT